MKKIWKVLLPVLLLAALLYLRLPAQIRPVHQFRSGLQQGLLLL